MGGDLMTATVQQSYGDYGYADQEGKEIDKETVFFCLDHPPWLSVAPAAQSTLEGLKPPSKLTRDWNKEVINNSVPQTWKQTNYEERYREHLQKNKKAKNDLHRIATLSKHREVCLVCGDQFYQFCIRRIIFEHLKERGDI